MARQDQWRTTLVVEGVDYGVFDGHTGGAVDSEEVRHREGGMGAELSLGGFVSIENVTLTRLYKRERDHARYPELVAQIGRGRATTVMQPLDPHRAAFGRPITYTGTLKRVSRPEHDSNSADGAMLEIEVTATQVT